MEWNRIEYNDGGRVAAAAVCESLKNSIEEFSIKEFT